MPPSAYVHVIRFGGLGDRAGLVDLRKERIACTNVQGPLDLRGIRHEPILTTDSALAPDSDMSSWRLPVTLINGVGPVSTIW